MLVTIPSWYNSRGCIIDKKRIVKDWIQMRGCHYFTDSIIHNNYSLAYVSKMISTNLKLSINPVIYINLRDQTEVN